MQYFTKFFNPEDPKGRAYRVQALLVMIPLSDFANDHHNGSLSSSNSNTKNFLTKTIFMYLMVGSIVPP
jgi:hypothetical protein